jgi:hypothetical protein
MVIHFTIKVHGIYPRDTAMPKRSASQIQTITKPKSNGARLNQKLLKAMVLHGLRYEDLNTLNGNVP